MWREYFRKKYIYLLENKQTKLISFDIFETTLFRKVSKPINLFLNVGKKKKVKKILIPLKIVQQQCLIAEKKARSENTQLEDITLKQIYQQFPLNKSQQQQCLAYELKEEYKCLFANQQIEHWIDLAHHYQKTIIFCSDMYLNSAQLEYILIAKLKNYPHVSKLFVSSEYNASKATGKLFLKVLKHYSLKSHQILHVGDNKQTDIESAKKMGINS